MLGTRNSCRYCVDAPTVKIGGGVEVDDKDVELLHRYAEFFPSIGKALSKWYIHPSPEMVSAYLDRLKRKTGRDLRNIEDCIALWEKYCGLKPPYKHLKMSVDEAKITYTYLRTRSFSTAGERLKKNEKTLRHVFVKFIQQNRLSRYSMDDIAALYYSAKEIVGNECSAVPENVWRYYAPYERK